MGTSKQSRVKAGVPSGGQFAPGRAAEPVSGGLAVADEPGDVGGDLCFDDLPDGKIWSYQADLWHPKAAIESMIASGKASPAARDMDPEDALRQILESNGIDPDNEYDWDSDEFPKSADVWQGRSSGDVETIVGPDGQHVNLYADPEDIPPALPGIDPSERQELFAQYIETARWSSTVLEDPDDEGDDGHDRQADDDQFELSTDGKRALQAEAAELWSTIPLDLRSEILESANDMGGVFHSMRLSVTGCGAGLWSNDDLGELGKRVHESLEGTDAQKAAEFSRMFYVNDTTGELEYGW